MKIKNVTTSRLSIYDLQNPNDPTTYIDLGPGGEVTIYNDDFNKSKRLSHFIASGAIIVTEKDEPLDPVYCCGGVTTGAFTDLKDAPNDYCGSAGMAIIVNSYECGLDYAVFAGSDEKVGITSGDTPGYLSNKLLAGDGITLTCDGTTNKCMTVSLASSENLWDRCDCGYIYPTCNTDYICFTSENNFRFPGSSCICSGAGGNLYMYACGGNGITLQSGYICLTTTGTLDVFSACTCLHNCTMYSTCPTLTDDRELTYKKWVVDCIGGLSCWSRCSTCGWVYPTCTTDYIVNRTSNGLCGIRISYCCLETFACGSCPPHSLTIKSGNMCLCAGGNINLKSSGSATCVCGDLSILSGCQVCTGKIGFASNSCLYCQSNDIYLSNSNGNVCVCAGSSRILGLRGECTLICGGNYGLNLCTTCANGIYLHGGPITLTTTGPVVTDNGDTCIRSGGVVYMCSTNGGMIELNDSGDNAVALCTKVPDGSSCIGIQTNGLISYGASPLPTFGVTDANNVVQWTDGSDVCYCVNVVNGTYALGLNAGVCGSLLEAIKTAMDGASSGATFTIVYSPSTKFITFTTDGCFNSFPLATAGYIGSLIGFTCDLASPSSTYVGDTQVEISPFTQDFYIPDKKWVEDYVGTYVTCFACGCENFWGRCGDGYIYPVCNADYLYICNNCTMGILVCVSGAAGTGPGINVQSQCNCGIFSQNANCFAIWASAVCCTIYATATANYAIFAYAEEADFAVYGCADCNYGGYFEIGDLGTDGTALCAKVPAGCGCGAIRANGHICTCANVCGVGYYTGATAGTCGSFTTCGGCTICVCNGLIVSLT